MANSDNNEMIGFIASTVETIRDRLDGIDERMDGMVTKSMFDAGITAVRGDIEQVHLRLDSIDRTLKARLDQMDAEIARLRSVVYLLARDRPELLRLLGQPGGRPC